MHRSRYLPVLALVAVAGACDNTEIPSGPSARGPEMTISDGRFAGGNKEFFFLPPVMPDPRGEANFTAGAFNANLGPTASVCELKEDPALDTESYQTDCRVDALNQQIIVASFPSTAINVSPSGEFYSVNWHTDASDLDLAKFYRLQVFIGHTRLGFADIDPISGGELRSKKTGQMIPLVDGRTLPIKFRIEAGAFCQQKADCGEFQVTTAGGTFVTNTGYAGIRFQEGFLPTGVSSITLTIQRVTVGADNRCHGAASVRLWREFEGCYEMTTYPDLAPFGGIQKPAIAGQCVEIEESHPLYDFIQPYKSKNGTNLTRLANADAPFIECDGFIPPVIITESSNPAVRYAAAGLQRVGQGLGKIFGVSTLHAIDLGLGEELPIGSALSNFNWAVGLEMVITRGNGQSGGFGQQVIEPLEVNVKSLHFHPGGLEDDVEDSHPENVAGVTVRFTVTEGTGYFSLGQAGEPVRIVDVVTDGRGRASVPFVVGSTAANVVTATVATFTGTGGTFTITGVQPYGTIGDLLDGGE